jgi:hypothetical protein
VDVGHRLFSSIVGKENIKRHAYNLAGTASRQALEGMVEPGDSERRVPDDDRSVSIVKQVLQVVPRLPQRILCLRSLLT